jgi:hypothetical protein
MNGYDNGRLDLLFVGICSFGKRPICTDWDNIQADVAVLGAPLDMGTQFCAGARFGPRAIREASTLFSFGHGGSYDHEDDVVYLPGDQVRIVDMGDADIVHTDQAKSLANIEYAVRKILKAGAVPVVMGGDHSGSTAILAAQLLLSLLSFSHSQPAKSQLAKGQLSGRHATLRSPNRHLVATQSFQQSRDNGPQLLANSCT